MNKLLFVILLLNSTFVLAQQESIKEQDDKYDQIMRGLKTLLTKIDNIEKRVDRLERIYGPLTAQSRDERKRSDRAEVEKWRKLSVDRSKKYVTDLLGLPLKIQNYESGIVTEIWEYEFEGAISFKDEKIYRWRLPKNLQ